MDSVKTDFARIGGLLGLAVVDGRQAGQVEGAGQHQAARQQQKRPVHCGRDLQRSNSTLTECRCLKKILHSGSEFGGDWASGIRPSQ